MLLTDTQLKHIKPTAKQQSLSDGRGTQLYCRIHPSGNKVFVFRYHYHDRATHLTLGHYPALSLKAARAKALECQQLLSQDINPLTHREHLKRERMTTFNQVFAEWFALKAINYSDKHKTNLLSLHKRHINPFLGTKSIQVIHTYTVLSILRRIEREVALSTRDKIKTILNQVLSFAVVSGYCQSNPVTGVSSVLQPYKSQHYGFVRENKDMAQLLNDIDSYRGHYVTQQALKLVPLVMLRPTELSQLEWSEVDSKNQQLVIEARRMKMRRRHIVPLSLQALAIIEAMRSYSGEGKYVFASEADKNKPISSSTLRYALRLMGYDGHNKPKQDTHGFRHLASTKLYELSSDYKIKSEVIEKQLAHEERNKVKATYNHAEYLAERRRMMQLWANYLDDIKQGSNVVRLSEGIQLA